MIITINNNIKETDDNNGGGASYSKAAAIKMEIIKMATIYGAELGIEAPRVDPVGLLEHSRGYAVSARAHSTGMRLLAGAMAGALLLATTGVTVATLGVYCLTTWGALPGAFAP